MICPSDLQLFENEAVWSQTLPTFSKSVWLMEPQYQGTTHMLTGRERKREGHQMSTTNCDYSKILLYQDYVKVSKNPNMNQHKTQFFITLIGW